MTLEKLFYICCFSVLFGIILMALFGCGIHPDIARQKAIQAKVIPPPGCEKVNTIVYGREAGCKNE